VLRVLSSLIWEDVRKKSLLLLTLPSGKQIPGATDFRLKYGAAMFDVSFIVELKKDSEEVAQHLKTQVVVELLAALCSTHSLVPPFVWVLSPGDCALLWCTECDNKKQLCYAPYMASDAPSTIVQTMYLHALEITKAYKLSPEAYPYPEQMQLLKRPAFGTLRSHFTSNKPDPAIDWLAEVCSNDILLQPHFLIQVMEPEEHQKVLWSAALTQLVFPDDRAALFRALMPPPTVPPPAELPVCDEKASLHSLMYS
jgi:hypothetical protein